MKTRSIIVVTCFALLLLSAVPAFAGRDPFDGKWDAVITPEGGGKEIKDLLTFKGSQFTSQEFEKKGFKASTYDEDSRGAGAASGSFTAKVKSTKDAEGTAEWTGQATASDMNGELKITKGDGTVVNYTFKATRRQQ